MNKKIVGIGEFSAYMEIAVITVIGVMRNAVIVLKSKT